VAALRCGKAVQMQFVAMHCLYFRRKQDYVNNRTMLLPGSV